nr:MAG TPA: receptor binding protein [Caudoviricetes sp.]
MAFMGSAALGALWELFKERISGYEITVTADAQAENTLTVTVARAAQACFGIVTIPPDNTTDTATIPAGFRPSAEYAITGEDFSIDTGGTVSINSVDSEERSLAFFYFTDNDVPDATYAKGVKDNELTD